MRNYRGFAWNFDPNPMGPLLGPVLDLKIQNKRPNLLLPVPTPGHVQGGWVGGIYELLHKPLFTAGGCLTRVHEVAECFFMHWLKLAEVWRKVGGSLHWG